MSTQLTDSEERSRSGLLSSGSPLRVALVVLAVYVVVGAVAGAVWEWVWTPPGQVIEQHQMFYDSYVSLRRVFTGTGLYVLVGGVASALVALAVCVLTRGRELFVLLLTLVGSSLAAATMWWVGTRLGPSDPRPLVAHTVKLTRVSGNLSVAGRSPYLVWPMLSLLVLALVYFGWPSSLTRQGRADEEVSSVDAGGSPTSPDV